MASVNVNFLGGKMKLEKAWDTKALVAELKPFGLTLGEQAAKQLLEVALEFVTQSVTLSESKVDDFCLAVIPLVKPMVMAQLEKIDGK